MLAWICSVDDVVGVQPGIVLQCHPSLPKVRDGEKDKRMRDKT